MKIIILVFGLFTSLSVLACQEPVDLLLIGDSQVGATWAKSYTGNFLQQCLRGNFVIYGRGATVPGNWLGQGGMDHIETIQRDPENSHLNLGSGVKVPTCKKRLEHMLPAHQSKRIALSFGGNYIGKTINTEQVKKEITQLMKITQEHGYLEGNCFFIGPTFEMEVRDRRNIAHRDLSAVEKINSLITPILAGKCRFISGVELMRSSPYFDGKELLRRVQVPGANGCSGAAENDNVHVCGEAARDYALRLCDILNEDTRKNN